MRAHGQEPYDSSDRTGDPLDTHDATDVGKLIARLRTCFLATAMFADVTRLTLHARLGAASRGEAPQSLWAEATAAI